MGGTFKPIDCAKTYGLVTKCRHDTWELDDWYMGDVDMLFAAPADSEIARLNGHGVEPGADSEAVALVRRLYDVAKRYGSVKDAEVLATIFEAAAFLAKEETK
jgi:hypothetical protein